jgi:hypothetical protein
MPLIESIPVRNYQASDSYHHVGDNQPINDLALQISIINFQVENDRRAIADAIGTQGTVAARLAVSLNDDGTLKTTAINNALHSIEYHTDTVDFVRMTSTERSKLSSIASEATNLTVEVETLSTTPLFDSGVITLTASDSITWRVSDTNIYADVNFPLSSRHQHFYNIKPVHLVPSSPDYINYYTTSVNTPYKENSLRVFINGVKLQKTGDTEVWIPRWNGSTLTWFQNSFLEDEDYVTDGEVTTGKFALNSAITSSDTIYIDFDILLD